MSDLAPSPSRSAASTTAPSATTLSSPAATAAPAYAANVTYAAPGPRPARPALLKRHSSTSTYGHASTRHNSSTMVSPGSNPDSTQPLRHQVRGKHHAHHARLVVPRGHTHGSRQNLAKMGRQAAAQQGLNYQEGRGGAAAERHGRQRSHEGDTEIRLPGSLDETTNRMEAVRPQMKRNLTAYQLPRNASHTKLKKNLSHGQLQRLNSRAGNMAAMGNAASGSQRAPPSPGLKGKSKGRPKSADFGRGEEADLHEQEVELARRIKEGRFGGVGGKGKVGFKVGDGGSSEEEDWTEESASASPYSTRQNTANNSRRASVVQSRGGTGLGGEVVREGGGFQGQAKLGEVKAEVQTQGRLPSQQVQDEDEDEDEEDDDDEDNSESDRPPPSPRTNPQAKPPPLPQPSKPMTSAKEHPNPTTSFLRRHSEHQPVPAKVSNITATDTTHTPSPAETPSNPSAAPPSSHLHHQTQQQNEEEEEEEEEEAEPEELVSRFIPSTSHPHPTSQPTTNPNTPAQNSFQHPISPGGSTLSATSSGAATPSASTRKGRSRIELKMLQEKALADLEDHAGRQPVIPAHVYDRRNESLKSYLNLAQLGTVGGAETPGPGPVGVWHGNPAFSAGQQGPSPNQLGGVGAGIGTGTGVGLGPEVFQGRFKAVQTELRVVQKFRDPLAESLARLRSCRGSALSTATGSLGRNSKASPTKQGGGGLKGSKSAVSLPLRSASHQTSKSTSQLPSPAAAAGQGKGLDRSSSSATLARPGAVKQHSTLSTSISPPTSAPSSAKPRPASALVNGGQREKGRAPSRGVSFAGTVGGDGTGDEGRDGDGEGEGEEEGESGVESIARRLWEGVGV